jgi:hypothetical protein
MVQASQQNSSKWFEARWVVLNADLVQRIKEAADKWSFAAQTMGLEWDTDGTRIKM